MSSSLDCHPGEGQSSDHCDATPAEITKPTIPPPIKATFASLPAEILQRIFQATTTPTFVQLILANHRLFEIAGQSREVILYHLRNLPGIKLGLDDHCIPTSDLFLTLRQRAATNLYGANFTADCSSFTGSRDGHIDSRASHIAVGVDGSTELSMVVKNDPKIRVYSHVGSPCATIESPYADGHATIVQIVQNSATKSVLYAWTPPKLDVASQGNDEPHTMKETSRQILSDSEAGVKGPGWVPPPSSRRRLVRYHLLHYNMYNNDPPIFFHIPTHRTSRKLILAPVQLAVYDRLHCAILWDVPNAIRPTEHATVLLYAADRLPKQEPGIYVASVLWPFDHPAVTYSTGGSEGVFSKQDEKDSVDDLCGERLWTETTKGGKFGKHYDLRYKWLGLNPRAISFFMHGRRLALYAPDLMVPYTVLLANVAIRKQLLPKTSSIMAEGKNPSPELIGPRLRRLTLEANMLNSTIINGQEYQLSLPFYSRHKTFTSERDTLIDFCVTNDLCIGATTVRFGFDRRDSGYERIEVAPTLTIVQIHRRKTYDLCTHMETKECWPPLPRPPEYIPTPMPDYEHHLHTEEQSDSEESSDDLGHQHTFAAANLTLFPTHRVTSDLELRVVARLWGWNAQPSTLTGLDTMCVSPSGERIAVAQWDRVLIYALDPTALCEETLPEVVVRRNHEGSSAPTTNWGSSDSDSDSDSISESDDEAPIPLPPSASHEQHAASESGTTQGAVNGEQELSATENAQPDIQNNPPILPLYLPDIQYPPISPAVPEPPATFPPPGHHSGVNASARSISSTSAAAELASFYPHLESGPLGSHVVQLRPIVLKMDGGAVVKKMVWGSTDGPEGWTVDEKDEQETPAPDDEGEAEEEQTDSKGEVLLGHAGAKQNTHKNTNVYEGSSILEAQSTNSGSHATSSVHATTSDTKKGILSAKAQKQRSQANDSSDRASRSVQDDIEYDDLTPRSRLQVTEADLTHQIKFVKRLADYVIPVEDDFVFDKDYKLPQPDYPPASVDGDDGKTRENVAEAVTLDTAEKEDDNPAQTSEGELKSHQVPPSSSSGPPTGPSPNPIPPSVASSTSEPPQTKPRRQRKSVENELVILTDRGVQIWDLGVWGRGRRIRREFDQQAPSFD